MKGYPEHAAQRAGHLAVVCETEALTYGELDERAARLARVIWSGPAPPATVAVMLPNCIEFIEVLAATAKLQCASLTLNWHLSADELAFILADSGAAVLVTHVDLAPVVDAAVTGTSCEVLWVGGDYEARLAAVTEIDLPYLWPSSWPVIYTSGTSGRPKGVVHGAMASAEIMEMAQDGILALWGYRPTDVHLVAGPLYHAGPAGYANSTLYAGGTVVIMEKWDPMEFLRLVQTHRVTTTFLTPAHFIRLLEVRSEVRDRFDTSSLRHVLHAGAPCPVPVKRSIIDAFPSGEVWELYGMSEGGATRVSPEEWQARPGTVGRAWPGVEITVLDPETHQPVEANTDGLVYVRPAHGRFHYHHDEAKTSDAWMDDRFTVGDIGHVDEDGYLYLTDRQSDMVIRAGVNIYPREIEAVLYAHPAVVDCAVFGVPDERDGERVVALIETRPDDGKSLTSEELATWCRDRLDAFKCPSAFNFCDALPRDPNGKVLKRRLRDQAWAQSGRSI